MLTIQNEKSVNELPYEEEPCVYEDNKDNPRTPNNVNDVLFHPPSTPKTNKRALTTPLKLSKVKKSKRRNCTPLYSPPSLPVKENIFSNTDSKLHSTLLPLFNSINLSSNTSFKPKKRFLELIEETLNETNDNIFSTLTNQPTPDNVFSTLFTSPKTKINEDKIMRNIMTYINDINTKQYTNNESKVVFIGRDCSIKDVDMKVFIDNIDHVEMEQNEIVFGKDNQIYFEGEVYLKESNGEGQDARFTFKKGENDTISLSLIEVHCM